MNALRDLLKKRLYLPILLGILTLTCLSPLTAAKANAATLAFAPESVALPLHPGQTGQVSVSATFLDDGISGAYVNFSMAQTGGSIPAAWVSALPMVTLDATTPSTPVAFSITVPDGAATGTYRSTFEATVRRSNPRTLTMTPLVVYVEVINQTICNAPPTITGVTAKREYIKSRNRKIKTYTISGSVENPVGCENIEAWFQLEDEYGEMDKSGAIMLDDNGQFSAQVEIVKSRKGHDRDGRSYKISVGAKNEVGMAVTEAQELVVSHDSRKKKYEDWKKRYNWKKYKDWKKYKHWH